MENTNPTKEELIKQINEQHEKEKKECIGELLSILEKYDCEIAYSITLDNNGGLTPSWGIRKKSI